MNKKTVRDLDVAGKRVLMRVDFNVPLDAERHITDDTRIRAALPTIQYLLDSGASLILMSHLGRPDGKVVEKLRLAPVAQRLSELLGRPVIMATDCIGPAVAGQAKALQPGQVLLLENLRFHPEEKNDPAFARELASLGDLYVNDAFGTAHRAHASTEGVTRYLPGVAGFLMERELNFLGSALEHPQRPFAAIIGGAKVSDKIKVLERLISMVDSLLIGGGMANTFLKAEGYEIGDSLYEEGKVELARDLLNQARARSLTLLLPVDVVVADRFAADAQHKVVAVSEVQAGWRIMDIGPATVEAFRKNLETARTIVWNGTLGVAEWPAFAEGTNAIIGILAQRTQEGATTIIGGGDSAAAVDAAGAGQRMSHVSTGGGASLEFLEGRTLPGVAALQDAPSMKKPVRTIIIAGNWKMHYGPRQAAAFAREILPDLVPLIEASAHLMSILCPPAISLPAVHDVMREHYHRRIELGAQNMYFEEKGAFTGELSPSMVRELCTSVILGHSERRAYFGESDQLVNKKTLAALHHGLRPIVCIGEREDQHDAGQTHQVISDQAHHSLAHLPPEQAHEIVIAYEPIWAIGTGKAATPEGAGEVIASIRQVYGEMYDVEAAQAIRILYGGSVTSDNISDFIAHPEIDGALVGGASIKPDFVEIVRKTIETVGM